MTSPSDSIPVCSKAALRYQNRAVFWQYNTISNLFVSMPCWVKEFEWLSKHFLTFFSCCTSDRQLHYMEKHRKAHRLNHRNHKTGGEMGLIWVCTSKTQQLSADLIFSAVIPNGSILSFLQTIILSCITNIILNMLGSAATMFQPRQEKRDKFLKYTRRVEEKM